MELRDYKLFIYDDINYDAKKNSSIRQEYWEQLENIDNWCSLSKRIYDKVKEIGWLDDLIDLDIDISRSNFIMKKLELTDRHKISLIRLDDFISNYFINFEMELKENQDLPRKVYLFTDFEKGEAFYVKFTL